MENANLVEGAKIEGLEELVVYRDKFTLGMKKGSATLILVILSFIFQVEVFGNLMTQHVAIWLWIVMLIVFLSTAGNIAFMVRKLVAIKSVLRYYEARIAAKEENNVLFERITALKASGNPGS